MELAELLGFDELELVAEILARSGWDLYRSTPFNQSSRSGI
jgi:hypothetical protein